MSMYIRVKRKKQTFFVHVEPTDSILEVKQKLQELTEQPPENQQLWSKGGVQLEDAKKLADLKIENDDIIALCFAQEDGQFEPVDITPYEPSDKLDS